MRIPALFLLLISTQATQGHAQLICQYGAPMSGSRVVPANQSAGQGQAEAMYRGWDCLPQDTDDSLTVFVSWVGLEGACTGARIAKGQSGENGDVMHVLADSAFASGSRFTLVVSEELATELYSERLYILLLSDAYPDGELRGQFEVLPSPTQDKTWGAVKATVR